MTAARVSHIAVPLPDGRIFVMGGGSGRLGDLRSAEVFDPRRGAFTSVGPMGTNHYLATRLADGRVLLTGGQDAPGEILRSAELFDPETNRFHRTGDMVVPRVKHAAALLADGRVLVIGGSDRRGFRERFVSTEVYDPASGSFREGPALRWPRHKLRDAVAALPGGAVVIAGGDERLELWDPAAAAFLPLEGTLSGAQMFATATVLASGEVLVLGGYDERIVPSAGAWAVRPRR
jgi:PAS domain-containing protein